MVVTIGVGLILTAAATMSLQPVFMQQHVNDAYNTTLNSLRRARDQASADMRVYIVTFTPAVAGVNGGTITATEQTAGTQLFSETLPPDVTFHVEPGVPTSNTVAPTTPDGFGTASNGPFDFGWGAAGDTGGSSTIYFYPDGTAKDINGNVNNGVVYMDISGRLPTCRAVSVWGYTGRIRGWRLTQVGAVWTWSQM